MCVGCIDGKKVYEADVEFPAEMTEKITHAMEEGFVDKFRERTTYTYFKAALVMSFLFASFIKGR